MARPFSTTPPAYRLHKPTGQAVVTLNGQDHYVGQHGSPESRAEYDRLVAEWLAHGRRLPVRGDAADAITILELVALYRRHVEVYYVKDGKPTGEQHNIDQAMRWIARLYGHTPAASFGPLALKAVRGRMIDQGHCRDYINKNILRIRQMFNWAVENELLSATVSHALQAVKGLRRGRSTAREADPVRPVPDAFVDAIKPFVRRQVWAMIELQRLTGMRPGEVVIMRGCDLQTDGEIWEYRPARHKTEHHDRSRIIPLGPRAQMIVKSFLTADLNAYLFSPLQAEEERREEAHRARKTPLSCGNRPGTNRRQHRKRSLRARYDVNSYRRAIARGCDLAFPLPDDLAKHDRRWGEKIEDWQKRTGEAKAAAIQAWRHEHRWHPHQLRHNLATDLRKRFGIEAARVVLGHKSSVVTEVYAELDQSRAVEIARQVG